MSVTASWRRPALIAALAAVALAAAMFAAADGANADTRCPNTFRVLHDDHVGLAAEAGGAEGDFLIRVEDGDVRGAPFLERAAGNAQDAGRSRREEMDEARET